MPKLINRNPKLSKLKKYAVVYLNGKPNYLGLYGSQASKVAYARLIAEIQANPTVFLQKEKKLLPSAISLPHSLTMRRQAPTR